MAEFGIVEDPIGEAPEQPLASAHFRHCLPGS